MNVTLNSWIILIVLGTWLAWDLYTRANVWFWSWRLKRHVNQFGDAVDELARCMGLDPAEIRAEMEDE